MHQPQPRDLLRPPQVVQAKGLRIPRSVNRRTLRRRHQIGPDVNARLPRRRQKQLEIVPVRLPVPYEIKIGIHTELRQARDHALDVQTPVTAAKLRIIVREESGVFQETRAGARPGRPAERDQTGQDPPLHCLAP